MSGKDLGHYPVQEALDKFPFGKKEWSCAPSKFIKQLSVLRQHSVGEGKCS